MTTTDRICTIEGCEKPHKAHGLCAAHNERRRLGKDLTAPLRQYEYGGVCKIEGCEERRSDSADYCRRHRMRVRRRGDAGSAELQRSPANKAVWNTPEYRRRFLRLKRYGLTPEEFDAILARQRGACAVCRTVDPKTARAGTWCVDHDHVTGQVRGLLCATCNRGLGMFKDDPKILAAGVIYIEAHRQMMLFGPAGEKSAL